MPVLSYLADTNTISDWLAGSNPAALWLDQHRDQVAISTLTLAEMRAGFGLRREGKAKRQLERRYKMMQSDFHGAIWFFDEASAAEWGRLVAEANTRNHPLPLMDSLISAIARSMGAIVVSSDNNGFKGCARIDPWTGAEYPAW